MPLIDESYKEDYRDGCTCDYCEEYSMKYAPDECNNEEEDEDMATYDGVDEVSAAYFRHLYEQHLVGREQDNTINNNNTTKERTMNLYNVAAIVVEHDDDDGNKVEAKVAVGPETILAPNSEVAKLSCIRKLKDEDATDLTLVDVIVRAW